MKMRTPVFISRHSTFPRFSRKPLKKITCNQKHDYKTLKLFFFLNSHKKNCHVNFFCLIFYTPSVGKQLGAGTFGVVHKAEAKGIDPTEPSTTVAVKMVKRHSDPATVRDLASELKIMAHLGRHPHVVNLLGAG